MGNVKAVISTAGFGSRMFPVTVAVDKCLMPIGNRPVIDYLISELAAADIRDIAFVTLPGNTQIRRYVEEQEWIKHYFERQGWRAKYEPIAELHKRLSDINFHWIEQPIDGRYGTAVSAALARPFVSDSDWLLLSGDDVVLREDGGSDLADLLAARRDAGTQAAIQVTRVPRNRVSSYGIIRSRQRDGHLMLDDIVEKPNLKHAPSNLANISRFLVGPDFFDYLDALAPDPASGEFYAPDALSAYAINHHVLVHTIDGQYYDCGSIDGWLRANLAVAGHTHKLSSPVPEHRPL